MIIDEDSEIVLMVCLVVVLVNSLFISSIFIYMCCCTIQVVDLHSKRRERCSFMKKCLFSTKDSNIISNESSSSTSQNHLDNIILQVTDSDSDSDIK